MAGLKWYAEHSACLFCRTIGHQINNCNHPTFDKNFKNRGGGSKYNNNVHNIVNLEKIDVKKNDNSINNKVNNYSLKESNNFLTMKSFSTDLSEDQKSSNNINSSNNNNYIVYNNIPIKKTLQNWRLNSNILAEIFSQCGTATIDLFADSTNYNCDYFYSINPKDKINPYCIGIDAFLTKWSDPKEFYYINPPYQLIQKIIDKIIQDKTPKILIILPEDYLTDKTRQQLKNELNIITTFNIPHNNNTFLPHQIQKSVNHPGVGSPCWKQTTAYLVSPQHEESTKI